VQVIWSITALILGLAVGSFLNVCIYRLPRSESIVYPGSRCPACGTPLKWYHNIPVASFVALRGRCAFCGSSISLAYPLVELCMGVLSLALFVRYGPTLTFVSFFLFVAALLAVAFIDLRTRIIPDVISLPGLVLGFLSSLVRDDITLWQSLIGLLAGGGCLFLVSWGYYLLTKREGMGMGDVKLMAMIGAFLGWQAIIFVILSSSFLGAVTGTFLMLKKREDSKLAIPFGPFLSLGALLYLFQGPALVDWYLNFFR
jgi:leader peptidase (prepilin peptidase)/N-methyltransferase